MSDIEKVKKLREATGAGFKDCNLAIKESNGDLDKAIEILRVKGISKASKKMSRDAKEGVVVISGDNTKTSVIEVNCETDFVAKNDDFISFVKELSELNNKNSSNIEELKVAKMKNGQTVDDNLVALIAKIGEKITIGKAKTIKNSNGINNHYLHTVVKDNVAKLAVMVSLDTKDNSDTVKTFSKQLSMHIAASNPLALDSNSIDQAIINKEQELVTEELKNSGKPEDIAKKITKQESNISAEDKKNILIPEVAKDLVEQINFIARSSEYVDAKSGISTRMSITAYENLVSTAKRRMLVNGETNTVIRLTDFTGVVPSINGKVELVYEGEQEGADQVSYSLIEEAIKSVFNLLFPPIKSLEKPNEQTPYDDVIQWFTKKGKEVFIGDDFNDREYRNELDKVDGLSAIISKNCKNINVEEIYFYKEILIWGLSCFKKLTKTRSLEGIEFKDSIGSYLNNLNS